MNCLPAQVVLHSFGNGEFIGRDYQWSMVLDWHDLSPTYFYSVQYVTADSGAFGAYDAIIMDVNGGPHQVLVEVKMIQTTHFGAPYVTKDQIMQATMHNHLIVSTFVCDMPPSVRRIMLG